MESVNDKTKGAVKLTRGDAVKLVAAELTSAYAGEVERAEELVQRARADFLRDVEARAYRENDAVLTPVVGESPCTRAVYSVYPDGTDDGDQADVVFSDSPKSYEARNKVTVRVPVDEDLLAAWHTAVQNRERAVERDTRAGAMTREARETLIKAALDELPEGGELVAAVKNLAKAIKERDHSADT